MNELDDFRRLRPDDVALDAATSERVWHAINGTEPGDLSTPSTQHRTDVNRMVFDDLRAPRRRRYAVLGAAAVVVAGVAGFVAIQDGSRSTPLSGATAKTPADASEFEASGPSMPDANVAALALDTVSWQQAVDTGSLARSQVWGVVSGPGGFVATGMGFDDGKNQGRVWFSPDGLSWVEPALEVFDAEAVGYPAATRDAFFVVAQSNTDRLGLGEGAAAPNDAQLFRSVDGQRWEPWGDPWGAGGSLASTSDVLLRQQPDRPLEWSPDGLTWAPTSLGAETNNGLFLDLGHEGVIHGEGATYLRGEDGQEFVIWSSTDGQLWEALPAPPAGGSVASVPDGLIVISDPREQECNDIASSLFDAGQTTSGGQVDVEALDEAMRSQWECATQPDIYRFDETTRVWTPSTSHPGETPQVPAVVRLANTLVAALIEPDKAMTAWTAAADSLTWVEQPATRLTFGDNAGSPGTAIAAASAKRAVIITPDRVVDGETAVMVGTLGADNNITTSTPPPN